MLPFYGLSVTLMQCAKTAEDINTICVAYDSPVSHPDLVKIWLTSVNPFLTKFCPKVLILASRDIWSQITAKWLDTVQWSHWKAYRKPPYQMVPSLIPTTSLLPKSGYQMHPPGQTTRRVLPPDKYDRKVMSPVAKLLWPCCYKATTLHGSHTCNNRRIQTCRVHYMHFTV